MLVSNPQPIRRRARRERSGTTAVEFALVAPLIFLVVFAGIEFGRAMMVFHSVESAAMEGCREATLDSTTAKDVEARVAEAMSAAGIGDYKVEVSPSTLANADEMDPVTVTVSTTYSDISWLPAPSFMDGITLVGTCTLPREAQSSSTEN